MRAVIFDRFGGPEVLSVADIAAPNAGPREVRIRVRAATINPGDLPLRSGTFPTVYGDRPPPYVLGMEAAGELDQIGADAARAHPGWRTGDRVMAITAPTGPHGGAYAEFAVCSADAVFAVPSGMGLAAAATIPMNGMTALAALGAANAQSGEWLAVTGAAGAVGGYVVQIAAHRGARVLAVVSDADRQLARTLGATEVIARGPQLALRIREVVPSGVHAIVDAAGIGLAASAAVTDGGVVVALRRWADPMPERSVRVQQVFYHSAAQDPRCRRELTALAGSGVLTPRVARVIGSSEVSWAHEAIERGGLRGRLVLDLNS